VPGVLIVESMAQAAGILASMVSKAKDGELFFLSRIVDVRFKHPVVPGDKLIVKAELIRELAGTVKVAVSCQVDESIVAQGELIMSRYDPVKP
jgi:3-hydroxyacyl-[acyl-carrier-protein] dehydratase